MPDESRDRLAIARGVLAGADARRVREAFGVGHEQVVRDHLISHALAAISAVAVDDVTFFGGTALARTLLPDLRLSEDIDLIARVDRAPLADKIQASLAERLGRLFGPVSFYPDLRAAGHPGASLMTITGVNATGGTQIQLLSSVGYPAWPTEIVDLEQRYADAPAARLRVPTPAAFAASKLSAWADRRAPRDLYDLWALARLGVIDAEAASLFARWGPATSAAAVSFDPVLDEQRWVDALSHQGRLQTTAADAASVVADAWRRAAR